MNAAIATLWLVFPLSWVIFFFMWRKRQRVIDRLEKFLDFDEAQKARKAKYDRLMFAALDREEKVG